LSISQAEVIEVLNRFGSCVPLEFARFGEVTVGLFRFADAAKQEAELIVGLHGFGIERAARSRSG